MEVTEKRKETIALIVGLVFVSSVFLFNLVQVYQAADVRRETTFTVFDRYWHPSGRTHVMTYGDGKYIFMGNYTDAFDLDKTYHVYFLTTMSSHATGGVKPRYFLKVLEITEVSK